MVQSELCEGRYFVYLQHVLETESPPLHGSSRVHESVELFHTNFQRESSKWNK